MTYLHQVWNLGEDGRPRSRGPVVNTKRAFRRAVIHHFQNGGGPLGFRLLDSPNRDFYRVYPYTNRRGRPSVCFTVLPRRGNAARSPRPT